MDLVLGASACNGFVRTRGTGKFNWTDHADLSFLWWTDHEALL